MKQQRRDLTDYGRARAARMSRSLANALLWDVILQLNPLVTTRVPKATNPVTGEVLRWSNPMPWYPVVRFKGHYYLVEHGNPWPRMGDYCKLLARPGCPTGDLCITSDGLVAAWLEHPARRGQRRPTIYGVQDDIEPVLSLPVAGAVTATRTVRPAVPGRRPGADHEQLHG